MKLTTINLRHVVCVIVLGLFVACDSPTQPEEDGSEPSAPQVEQVVTSLAASAERDTLRIYQDTTAIEVEVRDQFGEAMADVETELEVLDPDRLAVRESGYLVAVTDTIYLRQGSSGQLLAPKDEAPVSPDAPVPSRVAVSVTTDAGATLADTVTLYATSPVWAVDLKPDAACFASMELVQDDWNWRGQVFEVSAWDAAGRREPITEPGQVTWQTKDSTLMKIYPDSADAPNAALVQGEHAGETEIGATVGPTTDWSPVLASSEVDANGNVKCRRPGTAGAVRPGADVGLEKAVAPSPTDNPATEFHVAKQHGLSTTWDMRYIRPGDRR